MTSHEFIEVLRETYEEKDDPCDREHCCVGVSNLPIIEFRISCDNKIIIKILADVKYVSALYILEEKGFPKELSELILFNLDLF